jgi:3-oxoacyl-(acyl-carrier-protein) synthase
MRRISSVRFACEVKGFDPEQYMDRKEVRRTDRFAQFALAVAHQAIMDAGLGEDLAPATRAGGGADRERHRRHRHVRGADPAS